MVQDCVFVYDGLPDLSAKYPWLIGQTFCNINDPTFSSRYRIHELHGRRIRGCFYGWVILSNKVMWSLWNPETGEIIHLPPLVLNYGNRRDDISHCCLSSAPYDPSSVLLLTRATVPNFVFCHIERNQSRLRWTELSYIKQLKRITGDGSLIHSLACCDGKVFALNTDGNIAPFVIYVDIAVKDREVKIELMLFGACPTGHYLFSFDKKNYFLKGSGSILFCIVMAYNEKTKKTLAVVSLHKLDMTRIKWEEYQCLREWDMPNITCEVMQEEELKYLSMTGSMWEEMLDLKDASFFVDPTRDYSVFYSPAISADPAHDYSVFYSPALSPELAGYIHIRGETGKMIHSCHVKNKTISISLMHPQVLPTSHVALWECRLESDNSYPKLQDRDNVMVVRRSTDDEQFSESHLLNLPLHILETIMEYCVGLEYMNFRATCKHCHLAAPTIKWSEKLLLSPSWLMEVDKEQGIFTFTDPMSGYMFFMNKLDLPIYLDRICYSRFGWLLFYLGSWKTLVFYNPFTNDIRELPYLGYIDGSFCFSAPPTSPDCMVVLLPKGDNYAYIHFVGGEPSWRRINLHYSFTFCFPTFYGRDLYALCDDGGLHVFKDLDLGGEDNSFEDHIAGDPDSCCTSSAQQHFLTKCDQHLLLVIVGLSGEWVEVFKLNDSTKEWEKLDSLGRNMICICSTTCLCIEAKSQHMENKIYFSELHSKNKRIVFYSLETCKYDTFDPMGTGEHFSRISRYNTYPHTWIEPSWS